LRQINFLQVEMVCSCAHECLFKYVPLSNRELHNHNTWCVRACIKSLLTYTYRTSKYFLWTCRSLKIKI